jgi:YegS/Rv2252/BmrU family lipid kinase
MKQKWMAIANPAAGSGKAKRKWPDVKKALNAAGIEYDWILTTAPRDSTHIVQEALNNGCRRIISIGGDGTHHEVVNGICKSGSRLTKCTLGIIPIGTGNDWARTLNIPSGLPDAAKIIANGNTIPHSRGKISFGDGREEFFMNVAGMCMDAAVVQNVPASLVRKLGGLAYLLGGVKELFTYVAPETTIDIDGHSSTGKFLTIHAGFGKTCGGGMQFLPHASSTSDRLAVTTINARYKWQLLSNIHRLFTGSILSLKAANSYSAKSLQVQGADEYPVPIEADGEFIGFSPFEISALPDAMLVCVPQN